MIRDAAEEGFVRQLRAEAEAVKGCFATYSHQAVAFSGAVLAVMFGAMERIPLAVLAAIPAIAFLMTVARIGVFKYSTANRNYGYELHLARTLPDRGGECLPGWNQEWREVRWEEALRAWRVVQVAIFRKVYRTPQTGAKSRWLEERSLGWINSLWPWHYDFASEAENMIGEFRHAQRPGARAYPWFLPEELTRARQNALPNREADRPPSMYHAGTYLKSMLGLLVIMQLLMLIPLLLTILRFWSLRGAQPDRLPPLAFGNPWTDLLLYTVVLVILVGVIWSRALRMKRRRQILENELLSIHSCAITWQAVVTAHFRALGGERDYRHYTERLTQEAKSVANSAFEIHDWLADRRNA